MLAFPAVGADDHRFRCERMDFRYIVRNLVLPLTVIHAVRKERVIERITRVRVVIDVQAFAPSLVVSGSVDIPKILHWECSMWRGIIGHADPYHTDRLASESGESAHPIELRYR